MVDERKAIRDHIGALVETVYPGRVFTTRDTDGRGLDEYVNIYFEEGEIITEGLYRFTEARLVVGYHRAGHPKDDQLDAGMEPIAALLDNEPDLGDVAQGLTPTGFQYSDTTAEFSSLLHNYVITY
ncbi:hypothetical protein FKG94_03120 [Exilibacterium tricleocarpae]|uniref:DUF3168 domain-containing protein n=1 Tax=Exilibacterium tricleocarpae TaxID=2591008 RepID=A0A545U6V4_9GAMM|nr:hypothetical protein [Exilibacterium tricleocarpae]TQV85195.1 hypothetical protein FKG94_03120 [Exilibacterium tricleocarpae]